LKYIVTVIKPLYRWYLERSHFFVAAVNSGDAVAVLRNVCLQLRFVQLHGVQLLLIELRSEMIDSDQTYLQNRY